MKFKHLKKYLILAIAGLLLLTIITPVQALQVRIVPENPQLGDTISVIILSPDSETTPEVSLGQKKYPAFLLYEQSNIYRAFVPTSPLNNPGKLTIQVSAQTKTKNIAVGLKNRSFPTQRLWFNNRGEGLKATEIELKKVSEFKKIVSKEKYWQGKFIAPNQGRISAEFGVRRYYNGVFARDYYHGGVDYAGAYGSPVVAPAKGKVVLVGLESEGFKVHGNTIGIDHGQGVLSIFLHLSRIDVKEGDIVTPGQKIGGVGSTGASTGPHLHWGLFVNGVAVDPVPWRFQGID